jgi:biotin operon repressor
LSGEEGIREVKKVAGILVKNGIMVDSSCGLHVHCDASDLDTIDVKTVIGRYNRFQREIDEFMPPLRRNNDYALRMNEIMNSNRYKRACSKSGVAVAARGQRYYAVNIEALDRHGTLEFRQHAGTISAEKIENWIRFCVGFVDAAKLLKPIIMEQPEEKTTASCLYNLFEIFKDSQQHNNINDLAATLGISGVRVRTLINTLKKKHGCQFDVLRSDLIHPTRYKLLTYTSEPDSCVKQSYSVLPITSRDAVKLKSRDNLDRLYEMFSAKHTVKVSEIVRALNVKRRTALNYISKLRTTYGCTIKSVAPSTFTLTGEKTIGKGAYMNDPECIPGDFLWYNIPVSVKQFYLERAMEFQETR